MYKKADLEQEFKFRQHLFNEYLEDYKKMLPGFQAGVKYLLMLQKLNALKDQLNDDQLKITKSYRHQIVEDIKWIWYTYQPRFASWEENVKGSFHSEKTIYVKIDLLNDLVGTLKVLLPEVLNRLNRIVVNCVHLSRMVIGESTHSLQYLAKAAVSSKQALQHSYNLLIGLSGKLNQMVAHHKLQSEKEKVQQTKAYEAKPSTNNPDDTTAIVPLEDLEKQEIKS